VGAACTTNGAKNAACNAGNIQNLNFAIHPSYTVSGNVFIDTNGDGIQNNGETAYTGGLTITGSGGTVTTNAANGTYTVSNLNAGNYTVSYTSLPAGYFMTYPLNAPPSFGITVGANCTTNGAKNAACNAGNIQNLNFAIHPLYTISGNVFVDANKNGLIDAGEANYAAKPTITTTNGTITANANGSYTITNIPAGAVTVSYSSLPNNYLMTSPVNGPPPSYTVTVGNACTANGAIGAACNGGNITNLNFGITDFYPWWQISCSDVRENPIADKLPAGATALVSNATCSNLPGLPFTGNLNASFGQGQDSATNQIVGGASYPEVYSPTSNVLATSYASLLAKAQNAGITPTSLASVCTITNCSLPANLAHGIYLANGDVTLNAFTFPANANYVILINGNLTINGAITVPVGSTALFATAGNISVAPTVGSTAAVTTSTLAGWYVAGQSFILPTQGNCTDLRLNIAGSVVVDAQGGGGTLQNNRDLCGNDATDPTISFLQRLDFILNAPQFLEQQQTISHEVAP